MIKLRVWSSMACGKLMWNRGFPNLDLDSMSQDQPSTTGTGCFKFHLIDLPLDRNHGLFIHFLSICHGCYTLRADAPPSPWGQTLHYQGILKKKFPNPNCSVAMDTLLDEWKRLNKHCRFQPQFGWLSQKHGWSTYREWEPSWAA